MSTLMSAHVSIHRFVDGIDEVWSPHGDDAAVACYQHVASGTVQREWPVKEDPHKLPGRDGHRILSFC